MAMELLEALEVAPHDVESYGMDVKRLLDEKGPINAGDEAMFVAVAHFRIRKDSDANWPSHLGPGDDLFEIKANGDWVSPIEELDVIEGGTGDADTPARDALEAYINTHWRFQFFLNGKEWAQRYAGDPPWVIRVDTSLLADDYLRVEVDIERREEQPPVEDDRMVRFEAGITPEFWVRRSTEKLILEGGQLRLQLDATVGGEETVIELRVVSPRPQDEKPRVRNKATRTRGV